jgi:hypothetical protein
MSYKTPKETTTAFKDLELKLQDISAGIKSKLTWLSYAFGLADRIVETVDGKPYVYPAIYQDSNARESISLMPSDLYHASCFWVWDGELRLPEYNFKRAWVNVSCIFYVDLRNIAPNSNYKLTKTKIRQDILEAFRQNQFAGYGVLLHDSIVEDDITAVYDGFSLDQVDNKFKMYPKYAMRFNFEFGFLTECSSFNTYA